jgi:hypothetical protein
MHAKPSISDLEVDEEGNSNTPSILLIARHAEYQRAASGSGVDRAICIFPMPQGWMGPVQAARTAAATCLADLPTSAPARLFLLECGAIDSEGCR